MTLSARSAGGDVVHGLRLILFGIAFCSVGSTKAQAERWWPSDLLHPDTPFAEASPDIAVGPDGIPFVVWDYGEIWWVKWEEDCSCWSTPATVHPPNMVSDEYPRISIGADGVPWVIWSQYQSGSGRWAQVSSRYVDGTWSSAEIVVTPAGGNDLFAIIAGEGDAWVVSGSPHQTEQDIFVGHYENGAWVNRGWLSGGPGLDFSPTVTVDASGVVWVAWVFAGESPWRVVVSRLVEGQWTPPEAMPFGRVLPELCATGDLVFLLWQTDDEANGTDIAYRIWKNGWGEIGFVNEPDSSNTTDTSHTISSVGGLGPVVAWSAGPFFLPGSRDIVFSSWNGSGWSDETTISVPDSVAVAMDEVPEIALGLDGMAWASWARWGPWPENPDYDIWYARGQICSPNAGVVESLPSVSTSISILHSEPNPSSGVSSMTYVVREEGRYEVLVGDVTGRVLDRISLGLVQPGVYAGERAFRWPSGRGNALPSGVYFVTFRDVTRGKALATGRLTLLR